MKRKSISKTWMFVILLYTGIVLFGFGELVSRLWLGFLANDAQVLRFERFENIDQQLFQYSGHPDIGYYPTPNYSNDNGCSHNSLGYRGDEFSVKKPTGTYRIVLVGGSTTYSSNIDDNSLTYPVLMQKILTEDYQHNNVEVINAGVPSYATRETLRSFDLRVLKLKPDMVIVCHTVDQLKSQFIDPYLRTPIRVWSKILQNGDCDKWWEYSYLIRITARLLHPTAPNTDRLLKISAEEDILTANSSDNEPIKRNIKFEGEIPSIYFQQNLDSLIYKAKANAIKIVLATSPFSSEVDFKNSEFKPTDNFKYVINEHESVIKNLATKYDIPLFDLEQLMPQDGKYWSNQLQVNEAGSRMKAKFYAEWIHQFLTDSSK